MPLDPMACALDQARLGRLIAPPNPAVGAVLVAADGTVIGQGHTQVRGGPHAEVMALRDAQAQGHAVAGATAYVTLEPCSHQGRTGPCCDALIQAGVRRVVASMQDPNPLVAGQGFQRLRAAGIDVAVGPGAAEAREINLGFFSRMVRQRPWVRAKIAASLDGITALGNGESQWITSAQARTDGRLWRARACAILTGSGTVLADDPLLDTRGIDMPRQPRLAIVDSRLRTPAQARLFGPRRAVQLYAATLGPAAAALEAQGASITALPDPNGRVDLHELFRHLGRQEINEVHVEAGATLTGALWQAGLIDELLLYTAPKLMGPGRPLMALPALGHMEQIVPLEFSSIDRIGPDLRLVVRPLGRADF